MSVVGEPDPWIQRVIAVAGNAAFEVTPASGTVVISYVDDSGVRQYWDGSVWTTTRTELSTAIVGNESLYAFTPTSSLQDKDITFEGWINDDKTTMKISVIRVEPVSDIRAGASVRAD